LIKLHYGLACKDLMLAMAPYVQMCYCEACFLELHADGTLHERTSTIFLGDFSGQ
jgi:hypothetical protein